MISGTLCPLAFHSARPRIASGTTPSPSCSRPASLFFLISISVRYLVGLHNGAVVATRGPAQNSLLERLLWAGLLADSPWLLHLQVLSSAHLEVMPSPGSSHCVSSLGAAGMWVTTAPMIPPDCCEWGLQVLSLPPQLWALRTTEEQY